MSDPAETIRAAIDAAPWDWTLRESGRRRLAELVAELVEQADRIAWLEGEVAGWRIKLAECEERTKREETE